MNNNSFCLYVNHFGTRKGVVQYNPSLTGFHSISKTTIMTVKNHTFFTCMNKDHSKIKTGGSLDKKFHVVNM